jgi:hypothetical protein
MRLHIRTGAGLDVLSIATRSEGSSGLYYETAMPGGMTVAGALVPWAHLPVNDVAGQRFVVEDGDILWWGRVTGVADVVQRGAQALRLTAHAPWERSARRAWAPSARNRPTG